jgi:anti-anti-sigma factor
MIASVVALAPDLGRFHVEESEAPMKQLHDTLSAVNPRHTDGPLVSMKVTTTVVLDGELDCSTEREVRRRIARLVESSDVIGIDTRHVEFIDAAGIRTLLLAKHDALQNGATITVEVARPGPVARLLEMTGLSGYLA